MRSKLEENIWLGKVTEMSALNADEQHAVMHTPQLSATLALSAAMVAYGVATASAWPLPKQRGVMEAACNAPALPRARGGTARQTALMWRWAAVAAAVLAACALAVHFRLGLPASRGLLTPTGIAWAATDGTVIEGQAKFTDYFSGTAVDPPDHPIWQLDCAVAQWAQQAGVAASLTLERYNRDFDEPMGGYKATVRITLPTATESQVAELKGKLADYPWLTDVKSYSQQFYMSERWPETHYPGRSFVINGVEASYPQDFTKDELDSLEWMMNVLPSDHGELYEAFLKIGDGKRFPLADVVRIRLGETIYIEDYAKHFDRSQLKLPSYLDTTSVYVPASETNLKFDPLELLTRTSNKDATYSRLNLMNRTGTRFVVDLMAPEDWPDDSLAGRMRGFNMSELQAEQDTAAKLEAAVSEWFKAYPELAPGGENEFLLEHKTVSRGGMAVQWQATLWLREGNALRGLRQAILGCGVQPREWQMALSPEQLTASTAGTGPQVRTLPAGWRLEYVFIPYEDEHGFDATGAVERATPAQRERANALAGKLEKKFMEWLAAARAKQPGLEADYRYIRYSEIAVGASVFIQSLDQQLVAQLKAQLAAAGAPEPEATEQKSGQYFTNSSTLNFFFFSAEQLRGLSREDAAEHFSAAERQRAQDFSKRADQAAAEWQAQPAEGKAQIGSAHVLEFGKLPVAYQVTTDQQPGAALDELRTFLESRIGLTADVATREFMKEATPAEFEKYQSSILQYYIAPDRATFGVPAADASKLLTDSDQQRLQKLIEALRSALAAWNKANPPDTAAGHSEATLEAEDTGGVPTVVTIYCNRLNEKTMRSIAQALQAAGAPRYMYGSGYMNRESYAAILSQPVDKVGTGWTYMLIPQVEWLGLGADELKKRLDPEKIKQAAEMASKLREVFNKWLATHPELGTTSTDPYRQRNNAAEFQAPDMDGIKLQAQFTIWWNDDAQRQQLADELAELITMETGLPKPDQLNNLGRRVSRTSSASGGGAGAGGKAGGKDSEPAGAAQQRGTSWAYLLIPQVEWIGLNAQEMKARIDPAKIQRAKERTAKLRELVKDWLAEHPELGDPKVGGILSDTSVVEFSEVYPTGSDWNDSSTMIPMRANFAIWWNDDAQRKQLVDELIARIAKETDLAQPDEIRDSLTR